MKGESALKFFLSALLLVGVMHVFFHFFVLRAGLYGLFDNGISGLQIAEDGLLDKLKANFFSVQSTSSATILIIEWVVIFTFGVFFILFRRAQDKKEMDSLNLGKEKVQKTWTNTDLDNLYEVLKERKSLKLSTISKAYKVEKDVVMSWGRALEQADLVKVVYPMFGEPRFNYIEKKG